MFEKFTALFIGPGAKRVTFMNIMKLFRLVQPVHVASTVLTTLYVDIAIALTLPFLAPLHPAMLAELPTYRTLAAGVGSDVNPLVYNYPFSV